MLCWASGVRSKAVLISSFLLLVLTGCGKNAPDWQNQVSNCPNLNANQQGTFMAPVPNAPVQLLVDNTFTADQIEELKQAVDTWNQLGQQLQGQNFFSVQTADVPPDLLSSNFAACQTDPGTGTSSLYVVNVTDSQTWKNLGFATNTPGATERCYDGNDNLTMQVTYVNPNLVYSQQFTSVVIHEMGHMLGLGHSCQNSTTGYPSCQGLSSDDPYVQAVMYPTLSLNSANGQPQVKEQLQSNDQTRAACFY